MGRPMIPSPIIPMVCAMIDPRGGQKEWGNCAEPARSSNTWRHRESSQNCSNPRKSEPEEDSCAQASRRMAALQPLATLGNVTTGRSPDTRLSNQAPSFRPAQGMIPGSWALRLDWRGFRILNSVPAPTDAGLTRSEIHDLDPGPRHR